MRFSAVLFDLDGTLLDTLADIADAANAVLDGLGFPTHPTPAYRWMVGAGVRELFQRALPGESRGEELVERCTADFSAAYGRTWNLKTRPYDGVPELLGELARRSVRMAVLSNKPDDFTKRCVDFYFPGGTFDRVLGQREGVPRKPDPAGALEIAGAMGIPAERFVYLGDTAVDIRTALAAGMDPVGVLWGFRPREELAGAGARALLRRPSGLLAMVEG